MSGHFISVPLFLWALGEPLAFMISIVQLSGYSLYVIISFSEDDYTENDLLAPFQARFNGKEIAMGNPRRC